MQFDIKANTCLMTIAGSRAYGIDNELSDVDIKGVGLAPFKMYLGYKEKWEQFDSDIHIQPFLSVLSKEEQEIAKKEKVEGSIYELKKFIHLASGSNPNILDVLFCDDEHVRICNWVGEKLRSNRDLFLCLQVKFTHASYAFAQMKRIRTHRKWILNPPVAPPNRTKLGLPEQSTLSEDQLNAYTAAIRKTVDSWELDLSTIENDATRIYIQDMYCKNIEEICSGDQRWQRAGRKIGLDDNIMLLLEQERKYSTAKNEWDNFQSWKKNRNPKRAEMEAKYFYDLKHATQLVRLMRVCKEFLLTGKINVCRKNIDAEELKTIKAGAWTYDQLEDWFNNANSEIEEIAKTNPLALAKRVNSDRIDEICISIMEEYLSGRQI